MADQALTSIETDPETQVSSDQVQLDGQNPSPVELRLQGQMQDPDQVQDQALFDNSVRVPDEGQDQAPDQTQPQPTIQITPEILADLEAEARQHFDQFSYDYGIGRDITLSITPGVVTVIPAYLHGFITHRIAEEYFYNPPPTQPDVSAPVNPFILQQEMFDQNGLLINDQIILAAAYEFLRMPQDLREGWQNVDFEFPPRDTIPDIWRVPEDNTGDQEDPVDSLSNLLGATTIDAGMYLYRPVDPDTGLVRRPEEAVAQPEAAAQPDDVEPVSDDVEDHQQADEDQPSQQSSAPQLSDQTPQSPQDDPDAYTRGPGGRLRTMSQRFTDVLSSLRPQRRRRRNSRDASQDDTPTLATGRSRRQRSASPRGDRSTPIRQRTPLAATRQSRRDDDDDDDDDADQATSPQAGTQPETRRARRRTPPGAINARRAAALRRQNALQTQGDTSQTSTPAPTQSTSRRAQVEAQLSTQNDQPLRRSTRSNLNPNPVYNFTRAYTTPQPNTQTIPQAPAASMATGITADGRSYTYANGLTLPIHNHLASRPPTVREGSSTEQNEFFKSIWQLGDHVPDSIRGHVFSCDRCGYRCLYKRDMKRHYFRIHGIKDVDMDQELPRRARRTGQSDTGQFLYVLVDDDGNDLPEDDDDNDDDDGDDDGDDDDQN